MKHRLTATVFVFTLGATALSSCIWQPIIQQFVRDQYPGERPVSVIKDVDGKPEHTNWIIVKEEEYVLPPSSRLTGEIEKAEDGLPYSLPSEYSNILTSPYEPHHQLDYSGISAGTKVWDPYTRKPFHIGRTYTFN